MEHTHGGGEFGDVGVVGDRDQHRHLGETLVITLSRRAKTMAKSQARVSIFQVEKNTESEVEGLK